MEDWRLVRWKETLWHNGLRSIIAGIIWVTVIIWTNDRPVSIEEGLGMYLLMPFFMLPFSLFFKILAFIPLVGWFFILLLVVWMGVADPFVYVLHKLNPDLVPVEHPPIFSTAGFIFVMSPFKEY